MKCLLFTILFSFPAFAKMQKVLKFVTSETPPFLSQTMKDQGAAIYALKNIFNKMNMSIEMSFAPWERAKIIAHDDLKIDGFFPYAAKDMKDEFIYSNFIYEAPWIIVQRKNHRIHWKKFSDLSKLMAGNVTGVELRPGIKELAEHKIIKIDEVVSDNINLQRLGLGRVDFVMMDYVVYRYNMLIDKKLHQYKNKFEINSKPIAISRYGLALRDTPENKEIMKKFNQLATIKVFSHHIEYYLDHFVKAN